MKLEVMHSDTGSECKGTYIPDPGLIDRGVSGVVWVCNKCGNSAFGHELAAAILRIKDNTK